MAVIPDEPCCHYGVFAFTNIAEATVGRVFLTWSFLYSDFCISWFFSALPPPPKVTVSMGPFLHGVLSAT